MRFKPGQIVARNPRSQLYGWGRYAQLGIVIVDDGYNVTGHWLQEDSWSNGNTHIRRTELVPYDGDDADEIFARFAAYRLVNGS